jgi:acyl carrier protein
VIGVMAQQRATRRMARPAAGTSLEALKRVLRRLIEKNAGIPAAEVHDDSAVDGDLALDSMSFLSLQVAMEETFGISCTPEEIEAANRFDAIAALVQERIDRRQSNPPSASQATGDSARKRASRPARRTKAISQRARR